MRGLHVLALDVIIRTHLACVLMFVHFAPIAMKGSAIMLLSHAC